MIQNDSFEDVHFFMCYVLLTLNVIRVFNVCNRNQILLIVEHIHTLSEPNLTMDRKKFLVIDSLFVLCFKANDQIVKQY